MKAFVWSTCLENVGASLNWWHAQFTSKHEDDTFAEKHPEKHKPQMNVFALSIRLI